MARNARVSRPRRRSGTARVEAAASVGTTTGAGAPATLPGAAIPDDARTVYSWLCRFTDDPAECERLLVDVLRRSRSAPPASLRSASAATHLRFLTIQSVLQLRGVL
jgi:hypothetical protein